jgi:outer membrane protein W
MTIPAVPVTSMYSYERWRGTFTFDQWHVSAHLGKRISKVTPYLGVRYSDLRIKDRARSGALHLEETFALDAVYDLSDYTRVLKARNNFGAYVGTGFDINKNFKLNFEAHFIDEYALTFAGTLSF